MNVSKVKVTWGMGEVTGRSVRDVHAPVTFDVTSCDTWPSLATPNRLFRSLRVLLKSEDRVWKDVRSEGRILFRICSR